ncbi:hypothetical protein LTR91_025072 [Friedmanniomyces endolithicus]|uniref:PNPLA domain-containing protein n=1 Tax=Friedmanniomyces endolithicus TaxID=329885 RepID=A0AAN6GZG8_9PEZI|nr:hypothetical protein LTR57_019756 [Friedmanniomyces endolithicus]KAK0951313.1 hypothetical protein LTR91_025072 [Friedmanniomyces endolithicus]KAK1021703.1 hypothetical protein LTS16_026316 [Friedmanniomyces endolithicus]
MEEECIGVLAGLEDGEPSVRCENDGCSIVQAVIWHCVDCDSSYCSGCWSVQGPHRPNKKGRDGVPHEKSDPHVVRRLRSTLRPSRDVNHIEQLHREDEATKWFDVTRDPTGRPVLQESDRYMALMSNFTSTGDSRTCYPQLVSFIGTTNAGKSTLIKMLVEHGSTNLRPEDFPSPVVGSVAHDNVPTSGDTVKDSKGASGCHWGQGRARAGLKSEELHPNPLVRFRAIEWADTEESRRREFAVTTLYPRLLYTFSDCVVFVLRNPKTFQSAVLTKLLDWGVAALETSINQPSLPHCVVVQNGSDPGIDSREWEIDYATQNLLMTVKGALDFVEGVPRFRELANKWRGLGKHIYTVEDLILRYYSSFRVVRVPAGPSYMIINEQIGRLQRAIRNGCEASFCSKRQARMLTNADELYTYLQCGFDHFTAHLDLPFNFMHVSLLRNPIPNDFGGHILQLCVTICRRRGNYAPRRLAWIFEKLSVVLASCVLLDCARFRKGKIVQLFSSYERFFDYAIGEYMEVHLPCAYVSAEGARRCVLAKSRHHQKGHRDSHGILAAGDFDSPLHSDFAVQWKQQISAGVESLHRDFTYELGQVSMVTASDGVPEKEIALDLHLGHLEHFFHAVGPAACMRSHATCFCCVMNVPEHPLPCGHVLCDDCIHALGRPRKLSVEMKKCPLHPSETEWARPVLVSTTPPGASARVLVLDGGGIRGVVQLGVLRAIEQTLGGELAVQAFFDLIVSTGTGGSIVATLAMRDLSVESCLDQFKALCDHAFTPRLKSTPVLGWIARVIGRRPGYKTEPLYAALKTAFSEDDNLFGSNERLRLGTKIAVICTSGTGRESMLLASYRRPGVVHSGYIFERPQEPDMEAKIWQCVGATMANPIFFKPFVFGGKTYLDGGLRCPNPISIADREAGFLWPGQPDLVLSLGTGQDRPAISLKLSQRHEESGSADDASFASHPSAEKGVPARKWLSRQTDDVLQAEIAWQEFKTLATRSQTESNARRMIRINPDLGREVPAQDSKGDLEGCNA